MMDIDRSSSSLIEGELLVLWCLKVDLTTRQKHRIRRYRDTQARPGLDERSIQYFNQYPVSHLRTRSPLSLIVQLRRVSHHSNPVKHDCR